MFVPRSGPLRSAFVELHLVDGPDGSFDVLHSHETFVQRQVVTNRILIYIFLNFTYGETTTLLCPISFSSLNKFNEFEINWDTFQVAAL